MSLSVRARKIIQGCSTMLPMVMGLISSLFLLAYSTKGKAINYEDFALGSANSSNYAEYQGMKIHCSGIDDAGPCLAGIRQRNKGRAVLWLGNSQVNSVNQFKSGQEYSTPMLFRLLNEKGIDLVTFTQPNANFQEHYVLFEYIRHHVKIDALLLPLVFDDMRETGIRGSIVSAFDDALTVESLETTTIGRRIVAGNQDTASRTRNGDYVGLNHTVQQRIELTVNDWLAGHSILWATRPEMRGRFFTYLYKLRNAVFGITPQTKRRVIQSRYDENMAALEAILTDAATANITVLAYIAPLRSDVDIPYDADEYARFKAAVRNLAGLHGAVLADLESLIPSRLWGKKASTTVGGTPELDFMHFQAKGHELLAGKLAELLEGYI